jgi:nicotinate-nucleotide adenylyltransferase
VNLGLLGGTFDPPHLGHLHLARSAQVELGLEGVLFVPCHRQPLKNAPPEASSWHRCAMLALALRSEGAWKLCTAEVERGAVSYTADTLEFLQERMPGHSWTLLLGADSLKSLPLWHRWQLILGRARLAAIPREEGRDVAIPEELREAKVAILGAPALPVQSRSIRQGLREGREVMGWLSPPVHEYIARQRLYLGGPEFEPPRGRGEEDP